MKEKKLGVIGGMGPKATSVFFEKVIDKTVAHKDQDHVNMVILNHSTLPDRTEAILTERGEDFLQAVEADFELLEAAGVNHIAIPCNTSHYFYKQMQDMTSIPIIHMVDETMSTIVARYGKNAKVALFATTGTIRTGIYKEASEKYGVDLFTPDTDVQEKVMDIIYNDVKAGMNVSPIKLENLVRQAVQENHCQCVILACTELSCIQLGPEVSPYCVDALDVLVEKSIVLSGKEIKRTEEKISVS